MTLIDTHVHIDFYENPLEVALAYEGLKIYTLFVTNLPEVFQKHFKSFSNLKYVRLCIGYHPQVASEYTLNKKLFVECLRSTNYIGEVGLDFQNENQDVKQKQIDAFEFICSPEHNIGRIFTVHSKGTEDLVLSILKNNHVKHAVFHWYTGKLSTLDSIIEEGYYLSLNPKMIHTKNGQKIISRIPQNKILFETDGPFARINKSIIYPSNIKQLYKDFDSIIPNFEEIVFRNFKRLLIEKDIKP